ncbi:phospholipase D family protein [Pseudomonas sp. Irchel s3f10]|uniref:phospholipase D family protein n=1 Tax=Pseudomonas sp. Irchel s3f10 TaxID=2009137 RepID=UPI000BA2F1F2|nr:phospholipase D family protein [Pseudomonas sp. Irchel s3f10]
MTRLIQNQQQLAQWAREVKGSLDIAVAFWGEGAISELGLDQRQGDVRILLDLSAGATNPAVVRHLLQLHPEKVRSLPRLHAKAYIGENELIAGSANASANGLGIEGQAANHWIELGILTDDTVALQDAKRWFSERWSEARTIDVGSDYFKRVEAAWAARQKIRQVQDTQPDSLIAAAIKNPEAFGSERWFVTVDIHDMSTKGKKALAQKSKELGQPAFGWESWSDIPQNAHFISFYHDGEQFCFAEEDGANEPVFYSAAGQPEFMQYVSASHIPGFKNNLGALHEWLPLLHKAKASTANWKSEGGMCMDLGTFAALNLSKL